MVNRRSVAVAGMSCNGCERTVENALKTVAGVRRAEADNEAGTVDVVAEDDVSDDDLNGAIYDAGFEVVA